MKIGEEQILLVPRFVLVVVLVLVLDAVVLLSISRTRTTILKYKGSLSAIDSNGMRNTIFLLPTIPHMIQPNSANRPENIGNHIRERCVASGDEVLMNFITDPIQRCRYDA